VTLWENPIFRREGWPGKWGRKPLDRVLAWGVLPATAIVLGLILGYWFSTTHTEYLETWAGAMLLLWMSKWWFARVLAAVLPTSAIAGDRQRSSWDAVVLTSLSPKQILIGKFASRLSMVGCILLWCLPAEIAIVATLTLRGFTSEESVGTWGAYSTLIFLIGTPIQAIGVVCYGTIALWSSLRSRRPLDALVQSLALVGGLGLVSLALAYPLLAFAGDTGGGVLVLVIWTAVPLLVTIILWRSMLKSFYSWDRRVRAAESIVARPRLATKVATT